jgi:hypothetical protein
MIKTICIASLWILTGLAQAQSNCGYFTNSNNCAPASANGTVPQPNSKSSQTVSGKDKSDTTGALLNSGVSNNGILKASPQNLTSTNNSLAKDLPNSLSNGVSNGSLKSSLTTTSKIRGTTGGDGSPSGSKSVSKQSASKDTKRPPACVMIDEQYICN